jgi:hypothetical protein
VPETWDVELNSGNEASKAPVKASTLAMAPVVTPWTFVKLPLM